VDRFGKASGNRGFQRTGLTGSSSVIFLLVMMALALCSVVRSKLLLAEERQSIAVLPFKVYAPKPLERLREGLQEMLSGRLAKRGFSVLSPEVINKHPLAFEPFAASKDLVKMGKELSVGWLIAGSATQIGKKLSLDLNVVDVSEQRPPFSIFLVAEEMEGLAETVDLIAVRIEQQIKGMEEVESVQVKGNRRIEKEAILAVVRTEAGDVLDQERLDKDLRAVYKMGFFTDVKIETEDGPKGKIVTFDVTEKPSIGRVAFVGNKEIGKEDLSKEAAIRLYSILDQNEIKQSVNRIRDFYRQKGYYNAEINESLEPLPNNEVLLTYTIKENEKVYVTKIEFLGNKKFSDGDLKDLMETKEKWFLSWITKAGLLDKKKLEFDIHKITAFYHNQGFIKARLGEPQITHEEGKGLVINIEVHEGDPYAVNQVAIEGDLIKPAQELLAETETAKGAVFSRETLRKDLLLIRNLYADEGYAYAEVSPMTKEDDQNHLVDITFRVSKGQKVRFERINISGNTVTRDKVIRREMAAVEGQYFSSRAIRSSTENLHRLGYFEDVEIQTKKGSQEDLMVLDVAVKERPTGSFSVGAGYSSVDQLFVVFQLAQNNLFGYGQKLALSTSLGGVATQFDIRFVEPWLFDKPYSGGVDLYKWKREYDEYTKDSLGTGLSLGFPLGLDQFTRGSIRYVYDDSDISEVADSASVAIKEMIGRNVTSSIILGVRRDSRDRPWNTTKGSINAVSFEYAGGFLGGDVYFNKYEARTAWYFPVIWSTVFFAQGRWGFVQERPGGTLPVYQKFRLGGIHTVRGFDYGSISPEDPATGDKIGGEKMMVYNFEYLFPLLKEQGLVGLVFLDAGNVFEKCDDVTFNGIRRSAGIGIRWYSPMGPLRFEYGWNLDPQPGEESGGFEFSVGGLL